MGYLIRLLILAIVAWLAWRLLRGPRKAPKNTVSKSTNKGQAMLACAYCGTYVPADQAIEHHGQVYCCREHISKTKGN